MHKTKLPVNAPAAHVNDFSPEGEFCRPANTLTTPFGEGKDELPIEKGKYLITWTPLCGWSQRLVIIRDLLGLEDTFVLGKAFGQLGGDGAPKQNVYITDDYDFIPKEGDEPKFNIEEIYAKTDPDFKGLVSMASFYDIDKMIMVNNDWHNQSYYLEKEFKPFHKKDAPDLLPEELEVDIKKMNEWLYHKINNGFYKTGFAQSQKVYEREYDSLFTALDKLEEHLSMNRYLMGDRLTDSDIRLYVSLVRWDVSYYSDFNCNRNRLIDMPNLWNYCKELYQIPAFGNTTFFEDIKIGYHMATNQPGNLPKGPDTSIWNEAHNRDFIFSSDKK